ncbi:MFS transporter [Pendulispora albinea]|uniref:MFS transporter n=1 Tax=Pendulispora albinea TaxID=2741071 RepID=A0ABZ2LJF8_9BACT
MGATFTSGAESSPSSTDGADQRGLGSRPFILLLLATVCAFFGYTLLLPLVPLWAVRGGAQEVAAGTTTTMFMGATVAAQFAAPQLIRRIGYARAFAWGSAFLGAPTPLYVLTSALPALLGVSALRGIGFGLVTVCGSALVAELLPRALLGRGSGAYGLAVGVPQVIGLPAGVWFAHLWGYEAVFWMAGVLPVLACVPAMLLPRLSLPGAGAAHEPSADAPAPHDAPLPWGALSAPWLVMLLAALGYGGVVTFLPMSFRDVQQVTAAVLFAISAAMLLGRWLSGVVGDRMQLAGRQLGVGIVLAACGLFLVAAASHVHAGTAAPSLAGALAVAGGTLLGGGFGVVQNDALVVMFHRVERTQYGFASAVWNVGYDTGTGLGAVIIGALVVRAGYVAAFTASAVLLLAVLPSTLASMRTRRR